MHICNVLQNNVISGKVTIFFLLSSKKLSMNDISSDPSIQLENKSYSGWTVQMDFFLSFFVYLQATDKNFTMIFFEKFQRDLRLMREIEILSTIYFA